MKKIRDFLKQFFYRNGKLSAGKFWATVFSVLFVLTYIMRLCGVSHIDNALIGLMLGSLATVIGFYTVDKRNNNNV
jgi:hypothetical protein